MKTRLDEMSDEQMDKFLARLCDKLVDVVCSRGDDFILLLVDEDGDWHGSIYSFDKVKAVKALRDLASKLEHEWIESN